MGIDDYKTGGDLVPRLNRGEIERVSIRLSAEAKKRIIAAANNLSVSQASMIMYALSEQFEKGITKEKLLGMESNIILEREHFAISMPLHLSEKVKRYTEEFGIKKNSFIGFLVSDYFEKLPEENKSFQDKQETKNVSIQIHKLLKEKLFAYGEEKYLNVSFLIAEAIKNGKFKGIPSLPGEERELVSFSLPLHIYNKALEQTKFLGVPLHFYIESCLYNAFMSENKIFKAEEA